MVPVDVWRIHVLHVVPVASGHIAVSKVEPVAFQHSNSEEGSCVRLIDFGIAYLEAREQ